MIFEFENTDYLNKEIASILGNSLLKAHNSFIESVGSCLYNLRELKTKDNTAKDIINENARCNFELFEKGILLRINDRQKFFAIPLSRNDSLKIEITKGDEKIFPSSLTGILSLLGVKRSSLKKYWLLSRGFYNERFMLSIDTAREKILN